MDNMLILHSKCDQNVLSKNSLSTVNRSSQCIQDVITGFQVPLPPVCRFFAIGAPPSLDFTLLRWKTIMLTALESFRVLPALDPPHRYNFRQPQLQLSFPHSHMLADHRRNTPNLLPTPHCHVQQVSYKTDTTEPLQIIPIDHTPFRPSKTITLVHHSPPPEVWNMLTPQTPLWTHVLCPRQSGDLGWNECSLLPPWLLRVLYFPHLTCSPPLSRMVLLLRAMFFYNCRPSIYLNFVCSSDRWKNAQQFF